jgi:beta-phosphoglucomutase
LRTGVIFDMDGVLVASGPAHAASWRVLARRHGIELSDQRFRETFGRPSRDIVRMIWGEHVSDEQIRQIDDEKERIYRELITGIVPLTIGAREVLQALSRAGFVLAVATSGPPENLELVLRETGLDRYFAATAHGFDVHHGKPAPDCFLLAAERAGLAAGNCVVVEDAPVGIQAACAAGMPAIGLAGTHPRERLAAAGAAAVIDRLDELSPELVRTLIEA